ncbi:alpha-amylase family glycosyl hydrolase [Mycoplasmopsis anatis]|uniref:Alpha-amylase n=1 Tax=Mycoplasmopsis anatis 1340 TaxID=1034808 RepID=F9QCQ3_9BACT|nr:alpha-amylase family glycosyl hydrolase [Mycoplasmopsis anatis]EGS29470.1 alpha-amylase 3 [Mycoplasmopsis anatis 1340]VEU73546.1 Alpha-amylase precursor [Mycoplasmopsis anatis]
MKQLSKYAESFYVQKLSENSQLIANWDDKKFSYNKLLDYKNLWLNAPMSHPLKEFKNSGVIYQVLVYNFADGNNDGIGDFIGLKNKLDYFVNLGVDTLLLSPIHPSTSYHGYSVLNYCDVAPQLGGFNAFLEFLNCAHDKGIKVYIDFVFNHTSYEHPWFQEALFDNQKFIEYYEFDRDENDKDLRVDTESHRKRYPNLDTPLGGTNKKYIGRFWAGMPDLNLDNPVVIEQLCEIQKFWTKVGVDGFRYDAFSEFFSSESETKNNFNEAKIFRMLREASNSITEKYNMNEVFMIGEWLADHKKAMEYLTYNNKTALNTIYDGGEHFKDHVDTRVGFNKLVDICKMYQRSSKDSVWVPFLENHDTNRWLDVYRREISKISPESKEYFNSLTEDEKDAQRIALLQLLILPGQPIIYYADELCYYSTRIYDDPGLREPLKWLNKNENCAIVERKIDASHANVFLNISSTIAEVEKVISEDNSIYKSISLINKIRQNNPFIMKTDPNTILDPFDFVDADDYSSVIVRSKGENSSEFLLFAFNNHLNTNKKMGKISRKYRFEVLYSYKVEDHSWGVTLPINSCVLYKLTRK